MEKKKRAVELSVDDDMSVVSNSFAGRKLLELRPLREMMMMIDDDAGLYC